MLFEDYHLGCNVSHSGADTGMANMDDRSEGKSKNSVQRDTVLVYYG